MTELVDAGVIHASSARLAPGTTRYQLSESAYSLDWVRALKIAQEIS